MAVPKTIRVVKLIPGSHRSTTKVQVGMEGEVVAAGGGWEGRPVEYLVKFPRISRWPTPMLREEVERVGDRNCEAK